MRKALKPLWFQGSLVAAGEGFEPSHTESESAVLPLHKPAIVLWNSYHYTKKYRLVKSFFAFFQNFFFPEKSCAPLSPGGETML